MSITFYHIITVSFVNHVELPSSSPSWQSRPVGNIFSQFLFDGGSLYPILSKNNFTGQECLLCCFFVCLSSLCNYHIKSHLPTSSAPEQTLLQPATLLEVLLLVQFGVFICTVSPGLWWVPEELLSFCLFSLFLVIKMGWQLPGLFHSRLDHWDS